MTTPPGREPLPIFHRICALEGYTCRDFAVPAPGVEMASQVLDITRRMQADWVVGHLLGPAPAVAIEDPHEARLPPQQSNQPGNWGRRGRHGDGRVGHRAGLSGHPVYRCGADFPVIQAIMQMYQAEQHAVPAYIGGVFYNRGVLVAALMIEGIRLAIARDGLPVTGEKVKNGYERIKDFTLGGLLPPLTVVPDDHEGGGGARCPDQGEQLVPVTDWFRGYRTLVLEEVQQAATAEATKP